MRLKLKICLHKAPVGAWPAAAMTFLILCLINSIRLEMTAAANSGPSKSEVLRSVQEENSLMAERVCQPMLNFVLPQHRLPTTGEDKCLSQYGNAANRSLSAQLESMECVYQLRKKRQEEELRQTRTLLPKSFTFSIGDIDLPLMQTVPAGGTTGSGAGALQTAMKLLATFDSQLYGNGYEDDEAQAEDGEQALGSRGDSSLARVPVVQFRHNKLFISSLNLTMLNVHLYPNGEPRFAIAVGIQNATLAGQFNYDGYPAAALIGADFASKMSGHYRMTIDNVLVTAASNLTKVQQSFKERRLSADATSYAYNLKTNELSMNISDLGYISIDILDAKDANKPTSNYALRMIQRVLQKTIKRTYNKFEDFIKQTLEIEGRRFIDCELTRFSPVLAENQHLYNNVRLQNGSAAPPSSNQTTAGSYLNDLAAIIGAEMAGSHLNRISLPNFDYQRSVFSSSATIHFSNGSLTGLANVRLNGETRVKLLEEHLIVNASVGWYDLRPQYNWTLHWGTSNAGETVQLASDDSNRRASSASDATTNQLSSPGTLSTESGQKQASPSKAPMAKGFVAFNIKAIDFEAVISKSVRSRSQLVVDELTIRRLDTPKMDIGGLPGMNRLTRGVVNFFMGRLKQRLVGSIQPALKQALERALNRLTIGAN